MTSRSARCFVALLALLAVLASPAAAALVNASVTITDSGYTPPTVKIRPGERVIWFNAGTKAHTVTSDSGTQISSGTIVPGEELAIEFPKPGTFHYHSAFLRDHMRGTVVVAISGAPRAEVSTVTVTVTEPVGSITIPDRYREALATSPLVLLRESGPNDDTWWSAGLIAAAGITAAAVVIALLAYGRRPPGSDTA